MGFFAQQENRENPPDLLLEWFSAPDYRGKLVSLVSPVCRCLLRHLPLLPKSRPVPKSYSTTLPEFTDNVWGGRIDNTRVVRVGKLSGREPRWRRGQWLAVQP